jgi:uncharacterized radical SAM superfamily protein
MIMTMEQKDKIRKFKLFHPGKNFPAISITGSECQLDCAHCGGHYLNQMLAVQTPEELVELCKKLSDKGARGALISGGCDENGQVKLDNYIPALTKIKQNLNFTLNIHTGLLTPELAVKLAETGVDIASIDIVGHQETVESVYGLEHSILEYDRALKALRKSTIKSIVPHVCIGLDFGKIRGEFSAVDIISSSGIEPEAIVFIVLIPTKGSKMEACEPPAVNDAVEVISYARATFETVPIYLGCMRPKGSRFREYTKELELCAIEAGINGIVLPAKSTVQYLQDNNISIKRHNMCCAVGY